MPINQLDYDHNIKVGDIITGYYKGYWKVLEIIIRNKEDYKKYSDDGDYNPPPLVKAQKILDQHGNPPKRKMTEEWDISYSTLITKDQLDTILNNQINQFNTTKANLSKLIK